MKLSLPTRLPLRTSLILRVLLFVLLAVIGWRLPALGAAALAYSQQAVNSTRVAFAGIKAKAGTTTLLGLFGGASRYNGVAITPDAASTSTLTPTLQACDITSVSFLNVQSCNNNGTSDPGDDFFTADVVVNFVNPPLTGALQIEPGGDALGTNSVPVANLMGNSHTFTGVMFKADGTQTVVEVEFTVPANLCTRTQTGPTVQPCSPVCNITSVSFQNVQACNNNGTSDPGDDFFTADVTVNFVNQPATGNLQIEPGGDALGTNSVPVANLMGNSHTFTGVMFKADGTQTVVEVEFTVPANLCTRTQTGPTVQPCSACSITCPANITVSNAANQCSAVVTYPAPVTTGICGTVTCSPPSGSTFALGTTTVNCASNGCQTAYVVIGAGTDLRSFNLATPGTLSGLTPIMGLVMGETVQGIDFRPANGLLYGLAVNVGNTTGRLLTINPMTGATTQIGSSFAVSGNFYGVDFNPVADRLRVVSNNNINLRINPDTGAVTTDTAINPGSPSIVASAYTNNFAGATSTTLYGISSFSDTLVIQNPPNNGTVANVGAGLGVDAPSASHLDISQCTGTAYAALGGNLYTVNLVTGAATLVGAIGGGAGLSGFTLGLTPDGATATCAFTVTVQDTQAPTVTCPSNIVQSNDPNQCGAAVIFSLTLTDNCSNPTASCSPNFPGNFFPIGTTTVTCTASDNSPNSPDSTCTFTVTVNDTQPPTITCPANIFLGTAGTSATATWAPPSVSDNCPGIGTPTCTPASGSSFPVGVTTVTCTTADMAGNLATCSFTVTVNRVSNNVAAADPLVCLDSGSLVIGTFTLTNNGNTPVNGMASVVLTNLLALPGTCVASTGTCMIVNASTITWSGTLGLGQTATITYQSQLADGLLPGAQGCAAATFQFAGGTTLTVNSCVTINCPAVGPGTLPGALNQISDQKPGSVLLYPVYTSDAANGSTQNTRVNITNTHPSRAAFVHLFFVDGTSCSVADSYICLTANQTASVLTSDIDPGTTGYIVAIATDRIGCPINFNYLIGDEYVKFASGHAANLGAEAVSAIAGGLTNCNLNSVTAQLNFDGVSYNALPRVLAASNLPSRADGNDTLFIVDRIGGNLSIGAATIGTLFGVLYDDAEKAFSFQLPAGTCQTRGSITNDRPRTVPRFETVIPAGRSGWLKAWGAADIGIIGAQINRNLNAGSSAGAFNQGHNLHKLTLTTTANYIIPVFPPSC